MPVPLTMARPRGGAFGVIHSSARRLIAELRASPSVGEIEAALARLTVRVEGGIAEIEEGGRERVDAIGVGSVRVVKLGRGVYARVPTSDARVRLLELARRAATEEIEIHATISDDHSHLARVAIDAPRRALRAAGMRVAEPGDRFGPDQYTHCFFDEEGLLREIARAGLVVARRRGFTFVLRAARSGDPPVDRAEPFAREVARVAAAVREVDAGRAKETPQQVLAAMRARGARANLRGPIGRARLRRAIGWIDALLPGDPSCYRRILLETALDAGAARETVVFGLDVDSTGHVAFEDREERTFDVSFAIPAD